MAVDSFRLVVAMNLIEKEADSAAQRWDMLKLWLKKEEAAQQSAHPTLPTSLTDIALARTEAILEKRRARKSAGG